MKAILIDDEQPMLDELRFWLGKHPDVEIMAVFTQPRLAVEYVKERITDKLTLPDVVFLDIEMPQSNGLGTAGEIQSLHPDIIIVFVTAHGSYALKSFQVHPLDYLLKPIQGAKIEATLKYIRKQLELLEARPGDIEKPPLCINCFGRFQLSLANSEGEIKWGTRRVKELFMYLIDCREVPATHNDLLTAVFGRSKGKNNDNNLYVTIHKLRQLLHRIDPEGAYLRLNNDMVLEIAPGICDYTDFMEFARNNMVINSQNAEAAAVALQQCCERYLPELYVPWADETANMVEIEYERIALGLAAVYINSADYAGAEVLLLNLIARNPLSEEGFIALLDIYIKIERTQDYGPVYEQYTRMLKTEFNENPPEEYRRYYKNLPQA